MLVRLYIWERKKVKGKHSFQRRPRKIRKTSESPYQGKKRTLTPFSPVAETILRVSNCRAVTAWSYLSVSKIPPVRTSQICSETAKKGQK